MHSSSFENLDVNGININIIKSITSETNDSNYEYSIQLSIGIKEWHRLFFQEEK